jgi:hypothetical protein
MTKIESIRSEFVEYIPDDLEDGVLYISIPYATAVHKCASGCGETVVTPLKPTDWSLIWNRDEISLYPSIGNWSLPCKSHYWIEKNKIIWARNWSDAEIKRGRRKDSKRKKRYYKETKKHNEI